MTKSSFLNKYYPPAYRVTKGTGLLPETLITQLILESGYNLSQLATKYNNFFGLKSGNSWSGKVVSMRTKEYNANGTSYWINGTGKEYANKILALNDGANINSLFRVYSSIENGFQGWVNFLKGYPRYNKVFLATTPQAQFIELQKAGYATSPTYANELTSVYNGLKDTIAKINVNASQNNTGFASMGTIILIGLILASIKGFS
jgi:flagellum-specific peptidoglycan hydrolase FlgJ